MSLSRAERRKKYRHLYDPAAYSRLMERDCPSPPLNAPAKRMTAIETAKWLRESAEKRGKSWRLA